MVAGRTILRSDGPATDATNSARGSARTADAPLVSTSVPQEVSRPTNSQDGDVIRRKLGCPTVNKNDV
jgi:hypothetical protein